MSNPDSDALIEEIDSRLVDVEHSEGVCVGHGAICRGMGTLLRCQRAQLRQRSQAASAGAKAGGAVGAAIMGAGAIAAAIWNAVAK